MPKTERNQPKKSRKKDFLNKRKQEIFTLRDSGYTFSQLSQYLKEMYSVVVSRATVSKFLKEQEDEK